MDAETQSSEQGTDSADSSQDTGTSLETLGELLAADEPEDDTPGGDDADSSGSDEGSTPKKFNDLAGAAGIELDDLYKLGVQVEGVEETVTIEDLKDHFKKSSDFDLRVLEFEESQTQQTNELVRAKAELQEILQALPAEAVKPEVLQKIRNKAENAANEQRQLTLEAIPSWTDDETRAADITAMSEHLQNYGFPNNQLQSMVDHRWQRYVRDNMLREKRINAALAKVRQGKPDKAAKSTPQKKAAAKRTAQTNTNGSGLEALLTIN